MDTIEYITFRYHKVEVENGLNSIATNPTTSNFQLPSFQFGHVIVPLVKMTPSARTKVAFTCAVVEKATKVFSVKIKVLFLGLSFSS